MTLVRFALEDGLGLTVSYDLQFVPRKGEHITHSGDDPDFPAGTYEVTHVRHFIALRGDRGSAVSVRLIAQPDLPTVEDVEPGLADATAESEIARIQALADAERRGG